jgi:hypothetical protein
MQQFMMKVGTSFDLASLLILRDGALPPFMVGHTGVVDVPFEGLLQALVRCQFFECWTLY